MQPDTITLAVDLANTASTTNKVFTRHEEQINRTTYRGPGHTLQTRNILQLYRTQPTRSGNYLGSAKTALKLTQDISVANADGSGEVVSPLIVEVNFSVPVGATSAELVALRQHIVAILDRDDLMAPFNETLDI